MSQLDQLLERSRAPGAFTERRHFTLSRDKAIEKQREFALRHPRQYVLEIIQGAIFAGATYLAVDARKHDILIAWVGSPPLESDHLEHLFDYLFADRTDKRIRHMVQLAVGINAILQCKPKSIRLESGDGEHTVRMDMDGSGEADIGTVEHPIDGTYLVVEFDGGWLSRFSSTPHVQVGKLVEDRCLYTPVPILLNNRAPFGFRATRNIEIFGARAQEQFDHGERRGVIALHSSPQAPRGFRIVVGGVWISTLMLEELSDQPLVGVVCDDNLRKTADHGDIVQESNYVRMLHEVQPHATALLQRFFEGTGRTYLPPVLPPAPEEEPERERKGPNIVLDPLPEVITMLGARGVTSVAALQDTGDEPLFWCTPEVGKALEGDTADPLRFPFRVLLLTEGQSNSLAKEAPAAQINRLNAPSDVDFVLRVMERGQSLRQVTVPLPDGGSVTVRLHRGGRLPSWGNGRSGIPVIVREGGLTHASGVIDHTHVHLSRSPPFEIGVPLDLPGVSLVIEGSAEAPDLEEIARRSIDAAWALAAPEGEEVDVSLLAALLGSQGLPQFSEDPHPTGSVRHPDAIVRLDAALPPSWPTRLRQIPLVDTNRGPLDLDGFLGLVQTGEVAWVRDLDDWAALEPLERRFGYGHLAPYTKEAGPFFAVARIGERWVWVQDHSTYTESVYFTHLVYVARHFDPRVSDEAWETDAHPYPALVAIRRREADTIDLVEAWKALFEGLRRTEVDNDWQRFTYDSSLERVRALGRTAMLQLANLVEGADGVPLLLPSDGGGRWSLEKLRTHAEARVAAVQGVQVAEPHTFLLSFVEYLSITPDHGIRLRYDDHPDVWRSLAETNDSGWLLRTEVHEARLRGWLGLRLPYDATCGILLRSTGNLVGLPELDRRIPCHGLLWPLHGHHRLTVDERQLLQLAGLRMYAELTDALKKRLPEERMAAARLYAWAFCVRAHQRGRLTGTAMQLAQQVEVFGPDGRTWGTLDRWLESSPERRPPPPPEIVIPESAVEAAPPRIEGPRLSSLTDRLSAAVPTWLAVVCEAGDYGSAAPVEIDPSAGGAGRLVFALNSENPLVQAGMATSGVHQELLLLEMARQVALWGQDRGHDLNLLRLQQVLLSQRFEDA